MTSTPEQCRAYYYKNREKVRAYKRAFYQANRERLIEYRRQYRAKNAERIKLRYHARIEAKETGESVEAVLARWGA